MELDGDGALISYEEYFPYGGSAFIAGDQAREIDVKDYRYCGKECDDATSLYYYGHRYYAPWMGRWLSPDPIGPEDDVNLYQFVLGDPVGNADADGLETGSPKQPAGDRWNQMHVGEKLSKAQAIAGQRRRGKRRGISVKDATYKPETDSWEFLGRPGRRCPPS
jgi:RHS repeat-associated protein